ncbi:hypothetical protein GCM10023069_25740 [Shinella granuli]
MGATVKFKSAYPMLMLTAKKLEVAGDFHGAADDYYEAHQCALYDLMLSVSSDLARAAQEGRQRCFRQMTTRSTGGAHPGGNHDT